MKVKIFAKERPYLIDFINLLSKKTDNIELYIGKVGEEIPKKAFENECDILFSYSSPWIIPSSILELTKTYNINFHPGSPEYPGSGCFSFALYNNENTFGVTAHLMNTKVDTGKIIKVRRFPIYPEDTVKSLIDRTYFNMILLAEEILNELFETNKLEFSNETWKRKPYTRKDLESLYCIKSTNISKEELQRIIRSTYYPPFLPYIIINGYKFVYTNES
ncbi:MAG: hypothetical protein KatS3mg068_0803 [Candidatus Sericytochromatia bacterium]|nr:MAG: hypothetical protein KatS3mg068_0803 [Candidatus Sericytochromatia bacterium]